MSENRQCPACGHTHHTMVSSGTPETGTRWFCHESDHACYSQRATSPEYPTPLVTRFSGFLVRQTGAKTPRNAENNPINH